MLVLFLFLSQLNFASEYRFENSTPSMFGIHQKQDDLKIVVASADLSYPKNRALNDHLKGGNSNNNNDSNNNNNGNNIVDVAFDEQHKSTQILV